MILFVAIAAKDEELASGHCAPVIWLLAVSRRRVVAKSV